MSSKNLSLLGSPAKLVTVSPVTEKSAEAASQPLVVGPVSPGASPEVLKICYRLLASMSEIDGTILVTGMGVGASTSKLAVQMASGLSQVQSEKVLLVDGDLRGQTLHSLLGIKPEPGLSELLSGRADLVSSVREITPKLSILPAGALSIDASQFASTEFAGLIASQLRREFRYVVINSAPFGEGVSANLLAPHSDGVVLAINAGQRHRDELSELKKELVGVNTRILGIVLVETIAPPLCQVSSPTTQQQKVLMVAALAATALGVGYVTSRGVTAGVPAASTMATAPGQARAVALSVTPGQERTSEITPAPNTQVAAARSSDLQEGETPKVTGIRHWSKDGVTTVAIDLQSDVQFEAHRLDNPGRIYFDLHNTALAPSLKSKSIEVGDKLLARIRVAQALEGITRVVLDTKNVSDFSVRMEQNPYRLMIEVRSHIAKIAPAQPKTAAAQQTQIPTHTASPISFPERVRA